MSSRLVGLFLCGAAFAAAAKAESPVSMLVSGVSAAREMCVVAENGNADSDGAALALEPCGEAVAAADGRDLWTFQPGGLISSAAGKCVGVRGAPEASAEVALVECADAQKDGQGVWEFQGNGQLKLQGSGAGAYCLSLSGSSPGYENVADKAAAQATSTSDVAIHGAVAAVDSKDSTYWASRAGGEPVAITVDLGGVQRVDSAEIEWEFPAKSFVLSLSADGAKWEDVFATDANALSSTTVPVGGVYASKARVTMRQPHAVFGRSRGRDFYGIRSIGVFARRMRPVVEPCSEAGRSVDARDKFFAVSAGSFDPASFQTLRAEVAPLEAAEASLAATIAEVHDALPGMASCATRAGASLAAQPGFQAVAGHEIAAAAPSSAGGDKVDELLAVGRQAVMEARRALKQAGSVLP